MQDGASIKLLMKNGLQIAIISGRDSPAVSRRAQELGIQHVLQGVQVNLSPGSTYYRWFADPTCAISGKPNRSRIVRVK